MGGRVLVTGGASGIGAATCAVLAGSGFDAVPADVTAGEGVVALDVGDERSWDEALDAVGPLAGLVNCAGIRTRSLITETSVQDFERHLRVNVTGTWLGIRGLFARHQPGEQAAIVNIASVNTIIAVPGQAHYVASKGAVASLTKAAAIEGAPLGVRVNAIAPGPIRTPMTEERLVDPAQVAWLEGRVPLGRVGEPEEMAEVIRFLLSPESSYVTGTVVYADGGWVANGAELAALVPMEGFYHYGIVVHDLDLAMAELGSSLGLEWASVQRRHFPVRQRNGTVEADFRVTYSITGPPHYELIHACPGTIWDPHVAHGVHHLGFWSQDLIADSQKLVDAGFDWEASYDAGTDEPFGFTYHTLPSAQLRIELVDISRKPALDAWFAGGDFPDALEVAGLK